MAERDEARAELEELKYELVRWDEAVTEMLGPATAARFTLDGDASVLRLRMAEFHRVILELTPENREIAKCYMVLKVAVGDLETHNWAYAVSADLFQRVGLTERDCVNISQQIGALFYKRLTDELGKARDGIAKAGNDQRGQPVGNDAQGNGRGAGAVPD